MLETSFVEVEVQVFHVVVVAWKTCVCVQNASKCKHFVDRFGCLWGANVSYNPVFYR